jgi:hypothetical protein
VILDSAVEGRGRHFVILPFAAEWVSGDVRLNEELGGFGWQTLSEISNLPTTPGLLDILHEAERLLAR